MPSVIHTIKGTSASKASNIAAAAPGGGTYITLASGLTLSTACESRKRFTIGAYRKHFMKMFTQILGITSYD